MKILERRLPNGAWAQEMADFQEQIRKRGVREENIFYFMQGHTLKDHVVLPVLQVVCAKLRELTNKTIAESTREGVSLRNELSNYNNSLREVDDILEGNGEYKKCFLYEYLANDIYRYICGHFPETQQGLDLHSEIVGVPKAHG